MDIGHMLVCVCVCVLAMLRQWWRHRTWKSLLPASRWQTYWWRSCLMCSVSTSAVKVCRFVFVVRHLFSFLMLWRSLKTEVMRLLEWVIIHTCTSLSTAVYLLSAPDVFWKKLKLHISDKLVIAVTKKFQVDGRSCKCQHWPGSLMQHGWFCMYIMRIYMLMMFIADWTLAWLSELDSITISL